ncbi:transcriptional regulator [Gordonia sp. ABSL1-1]|uniref:transcriptional regulator n=1 Tax=Gordonia sp. ABSL1-1 TaxID=3053923 RepID=UPI002573BB1F|nr:transcriptional regulator [Gordonia sp. ABSL1-1]MDL9938243.1 transcriptional regulator [Gordonia sp. ABSL1-1]
MGIPIRPGTDLAALARDLTDNYEATISAAPDGLTHVVPKLTFTPDPAVIESWSRARAAGRQFGVAAHNPSMIDPAELERRRAGHRIRGAVEQLRLLFNDSVHDTDVAMGIFDADGVMLWRFGSRTLLSIGDQLQLVEGAAWDESTVGTTAVGLVVRHQQPARVFAAEHYSRALHGLYCTAAPIHDPRTGEMIAIAGLAGPAMSLQPAAMAFAVALASLGAHEMAATHMRSLADLRTSGAATLAAVRGPGLLVDDDGWVADGRGCTAPTRVAAPTDDTQQYVSGLGMCVTERVGTGWLIRPAGPSSPVLAELDLRGEPSLTVTGREEQWRTVLTRRHAQILVLLSEAGVCGLNSQQLSRHLFGDLGHTVTIRAEMSRLRRAVGALVASRPYRLASGVELRIVGDLPISRELDDPELSDIPLDAMQRFPA